MSGNQVDTRPLGLRMNYESMWSLLDEVPTDELVKELERFSELEKALNSQAREMSEKLRRISGKRHVLKETIERRKWRETSDNFKLTDEHKALIQMMYFGDLSQPPYIDLNYEDIAKKLGWKLPNDYVSEEQAEAIDKLKYELPLALEAVIDLGLDSSDATKRKGTPQ